jgi:cytochrome P450
LTVVQAIDVDLCSQEFKQNPFPGLAALREAGPVARVRVPLLGKVWMATTYEAVNELLREHRRFVQNPVTAGNRWLGMIVRWLPWSLKPLATNLLLRDEPDHRRLRSLVEQGFLRQSVEALRPRLEVLADESLDRLEQAAARSPGGVDLIANFTRPFPLAVICELLGLPPEDRPKFTQWSSGFTSARSVPGFLLGLRGFGKTMRYIREEFRRQTQRPRGGLLTALIDAEEAGDRLSEDELVAMVFLLLVAGHETTLHQIGGSVLTLLDDPQKHDELTADWNLLAPAVQELLRYFSFAQVSKPRYAREDTEFFGQSIRRGEMIFGCLAAANSDPDAFASADQLDFRRQPNRHLAFGTGIHVCVGAKLASVEIEIALQRLFTRFPRLRLAVPRSQVVFGGRLGTRSLLGLPVTW